MPDFESAPWNKPVEEEGRELRDEDIPARRDDASKKGADNEEEDPLSDLIFSTVSFEKDFAGDEVPTPTKTEDPFEKEIFSNKKDGEDEQAGSLAVSSVPAPSKKASPSTLAGIDSGDKKELRARLAYYEKRERELRDHLMSRSQQKRKNPKRPSAEATQKVALPTKKKGKTVEAIKARRPEGLQVPAKKKKVTKRPQVTASVYENKRGVRSDKQLLGPSRTNSSSRMRPDALPSFHLRANYSADDAETAATENKQGRQVFLVGLVVLIVAGGMWGLVRFNVISSSSGVFSAISGIFVDPVSAPNLASAKSTFGPLFELREGAMALTADSESRERLIAVLDEFFAANATFSWVGAFQSPEQRAEGARAVPTELSLLSEIPQLKRSLEQAVGGTVGPSEQEISEYIERLSFFSTLVERDGRYLLLTGGGERPTPAGEEPRFYAELVVRNGAVSVERAGSVEDLNGALSAKIRPPEALQVVKTGLDFYGALWFLDFETAGLLVSELYEHTTQRAVDGVFLLSSASAVRMFNDLNIALSADSAEWVSRFIKQLGVKDKEVEKIFGRSLAASFNSGGLQTYFADRERAVFARENGLLTSTAVQASTKDTLAVGIRSWEGDGVHLVLTEHEPAFFADGSVVSRASIHLVNNESEERRAYVKIYVPYGSFVLGREGFSSRPPVPVFDYAEQGFSSHHAVSSLQEARGERFSNLDFFKEGAYLVVGGWVDLVPEEERTLALEYRLPERLAWQRGNDGYTLRVERSGAFSSFPFRFTGTFAEGVDFNWREPQGFLTAEAAEYQENLARDLVLSARLIFEQTDDSGSE